jgi:PQQ-dependent dehydrogenase (methanol/ethanol family)
MKHSLRSLVGACVVVAVLSVASVAVAHVAASGHSSVSIPAFATSDLTTPPTDNWITEEGTLAGNRYSALTAISASNVAGLKQAWHVKLTSSTPEPPSGLGGEAPQVEYNGTLFAEDAAGRVFARDATTGAAVWLYEPHNATAPIPAADKAGDNALHFKVLGPTAATRGLALNNGMVYAEEPAGKMVALDASTGKVDWATQVADTAHGLSLSAAPVYYDGMILGGTSGGDSGGPCFVFALNASTGKTLWKFGVIPGTTGDPGYSTWTHPLPFDGGGAVWNTATVDPTNGLVYWGIGNPIPYGGNTRGPGQEHFTDGTLALHVATGKFAWFFQEVHHDLWDADQSQQPMLTTVDYKGQKQAAIVSADKDGLWYVLNADTGKPIIPVTEMKVQQSTEVHTYPTQPIPATESLIPEDVPDRAAWSKLTAADGKPYNIGPGGPAGEFVAIDSSNYSVTAAGPGQGASGNKPAAYDPTTGLEIEETTPGFTALEGLPLSEVPKINFFDVGAVIDLKFGSLKGTPAASTGTRMEAIDPSTGKIVWKDDRVTPSNPAALAKATPFLGGVLISNGIVWANGGAHLQAFSEKTGKLLWSSPALVGASDSPPTTYSVNGTQYVTTLVGGTGDLYAFALS